MIKRTNPTRIALLFIMLCIGILDVHAQRLPLKGFDAYVQKALQDWGCPGLAIAIVKNDSVVFAKGYGVRQIGGTAAVDEKTIFGIASCSKAFTSASVAILADEKKIRWDDPVTKYLDGFQLYDPYVTREITVRDLLSHRSGLPAFGGDLIWWGSTHSREETLKRIRSVKPATSFRSRYAYQNIMFIAAGQVVSAVAGKPWEEFVRDRFFVPLGMHSSSTSVKALEGIGDIATPHMRVGGKTRAIAWRNLDNGAPAAGINSNVLDMARWIRLQLGHGTFERKQIFSSAVSEEMWSPQTIIASSTPEPPLPSFLKGRFNAYGLGWSLGEYRSRFFVRHYGEDDGMSSVVGLLPEEKLGVVILTNLHVTSLHTALLYRIFDAFLKARPEDWSALYLKVRTDAEAKAAAEDTVAEKARARHSQPSIPLSRYAGKYSNTTYGDATVNEEGGKLVVRLSASPTYIGDLEHWQYDTFLSRWRDPVAEKTLVSFTLNADGDVDEMKLKIADFIDFGEYLFKRSK
ncbi:MAG: serine hydrolase [Ignavibacteriales bacterium]|nr:serine hydrolase [Ignavibacteriales bacterium]